MRLQTTTRDIEIGGVYLATDWISFDDLVQQGTASAVIEFDYEPEQRERMRPDPSDCEPYVPAQCTIQSIRLAQDVFFHGQWTFACLRAGTDLYERLNPGYVSDLADEILTTRNADAYEPDYAREAA